MTTKHRRDTSLSILNTLTAHYAKSVNSDAADGLVAYGGGGEMTYPMCITGNKTHTLTSEGADASEDGTGRGTPIVAFHLTQDPISGDVVPAISRGSTGNGICDMNGVRRLTPLECERLQGFPDGHTEGQSDAQRYRQMGNAVAVPVVEWIAHRLVASDGK